MPCIGHHCKDKSTCLFIKTHAIASMEYFWASVGEDADTDVFISECMSLHKMNSLGASAAWVSAERNYARIHIKN